jgi:hypothetical protein
MLRNGLRRTPCSCQKIVDSSPRLLADRRYGGFVLWVFGSKVWEPRRVKPVGFTASGACDHSSEWQTWGWEMSAMGGKRTLAAASIQKQWIGKSVGCVHVANGWKRMPTGFA